MVLCQHNNNKMSMFVLVITRHTQTFSMVALNSKLISDVHLTMCLCRVRLRIVFFSLTEMQHGLGRRCMIRSKKCLGQNGAILVTGSLEIR